MFIFLHFILSLDCTTDDVYHSVYETFCVLNNSNISVVFIQNDLFIYDQPHKFVIENLVLT